MRRLVIAAGFAAVGMVIGSCLGLGGDLGEACPGAEAVPGPQIAHPVEACSGEWCLYADVSEPPVGTCVSDADCNQVHPTIERFRCQESVCVMSPAYVSERSMCSRRCDEDADCDEGLADESNCQSGFLCVPNTTANHCCVKLCACADDLSAGALDAEKLRCASLPIGSDGAPMCE